MDTRENDLYTCMIGGVDDIATSIFTFGLAFSSVCFSYKILTRKRGFLSSTVSSFAS